MGEKGGMDIPGYPRHGEGAVFPIAYRRHTVYSLRLLID